MNSSYIVYSLGGLTPSRACAVVGSTVTHWSNSMLGDSRTSFHGTSALPKSCDPPILPKTGTVLLQRSSKTTLSCCRVLSMERISVPEHSKETDSFQTWLDLAEISLVLSIILLLFPAERKYRTKRFPVVLNSMFFACITFSSQLREEKFEGVIVCV